MADFVLSFVVDQTLGRVVSFFTEEFTLAWNLNNDLKKLQEAVPVIRALLQDAEEQQTRKEPVRCWLKKLKEVAYDAEDLFDELAYENLRRKVENMQENRPRQVCSVDPFSKATRCVKKFVFHVKTARKVKDINEFLAKINKEAVDFGLQSMSRESLMPPLELDRVTV